jgi:glycosyltransferase involved in cell wall biosynthesis
MAEAVARRGHAVHVVTYHLGQELDDPPFMVHRIRDVPFYRRTDPGPTVRKLFLLDPMLARLLRRLHQEIRFDLIHAHHYEGLLVAHAVREIPIVYDAHTLLASELPTYRLALPYSWVRAVAPWLDRYLPRRADQIIAAGEGIRHGLTALGAAAPERTHVIPSGVELDRFPLAREISQDGPTVIFTGNLAPYQGVDLMLEAFARLHARRADARLLIVTHSPFTSYEGLARRLGVRAAVELRGATFAEQPALLAAATVAVNPRVQCDGIPQKLLNYMAAGLPVATFEGSAGPLRHEVSGLRVPDGDTAAMAAALERLITDRALARRLGDAARDQIRREFSWAQVAAQVEGVYRTAIAEAASRPAAPRSAGPRNGTDGVRRATGKRSA